MNNVMKKSVIFVILCGLFGVPAGAFLGLGDIVFDPTNLQQAIQQVAELERQYAQLVQTYGVVRNQYDQMLRMAKQVPVNMASRYRALATPWHSSSATNTYGTTAGWIAGINTGVGAAEGYRSAIQKLAEYGSALTHVPADQLHRVKTHYATVELTDGANIAAMETLGQLRGNASAVESVIRNLENDSLSSDPDMNTEIAVLNKINAANVIALRSNQETNQILAALAEAQIIDAKRRRDTEAQAINTHIRFLTDAKAVMSAQASGASDAMRNWRMP